MFHKTKDTLNRIQFNAKIRKILDTPPVVLDDSSDLSVLTQLQHKDILQNLLALKSFNRNLPINRVHVLNDGSLNDVDLSLIHDHIPDVTVMEMSEFSSDACPSGGCWERLLAITELVQKQYVIQLDSDTLSLKDLPEVSGSIQKGCGFVLGTWDNQDFESMRERWQTAEALYPSTNSHVQILAEASLGKLGDFETLKYVRGCAGFSGFPRNSFKQSFVEKISLEMKNILGQKWSEWGSEQVMSNIVVANMEKSIVLPHPRYSDCTKMQLEETRFIHFIGSCRFKNGAYANLGKQVIECLS